MNNDMPTTPDGAELTVEQLDAVSAGYQIRESGGVFEVLHDNGAVVYTASTYLDAWAYCERNGGRDRR